MNKLRNFFVVLVAIVAVHANATKPEAVPGEYILKLKPSAIQAIKNQINTSSKKLTRLERDLNVRVKHVIPETDLVVVKVKNTQLTEFKTTSQKLMKSNDVLLAEPNYIYRMSRTSNDPDMSKLWGLRNDGQADPKGQVGIAGMDIGAEKAWDIQTGNKDLVVAVIDTGIDYTHADLKENVWTNVAELEGKPGVDDDNNGFVDDIHGYDFVNSDGDPMDDHGHGSHCSGTIGGKGDDGHGIVGVAWNVKIMGVKFLGGDGSGTLEAAVQSINYAAKMGARIMSNSWGGGGFSDILRDAIQAASDKGIIFTAAAGNSSENNDVDANYPASYNVPNIISVAALDNSGRLADFSCYGKRTVHVAAPGVNVYSSIPGGYDAWSGTSMATPHVTGIAALLLSQEPNLTPMEVKDRLIKTSRPVAGLRGKVASNGFVNAYLALTNQVAPPDPNDPANWTDFKEVNISSPHPYTDFFTQSWEVEIPGASQVAVFFENFKTEARFDVVTLTNRAGEKVGELSGDAGGSWSEAVPGDYVKLTFKSDGSVNAYGFDIKKAAYKPASSTLQ